MVSISRGRGFLVERVIQDYWMCLFMQRLRRIAYSGVLYSHSCGKWSIFKLSSNKKGYLTSQKNRHRTSENQDASISRSWNHLRYSLDKKERKIKPQYKKRCSRDVSHTWDMGFRFRSHCKKRMRLGTKTHVIFTNEMRVHLFCVSSWVINLRVLSKQCKSHFVRELL